jgi:hypothetical protein
MLPRLASHRHHGSHWAASRGTNLRGESEIIAATGMDSVEEENLRKLPARRLLNRKGKIFSGSNEHDRVLLTVGPFHNQSSNDASINLT